MPPKKLVLSSNLCPGDILTMTAAVESLHRCYPGEYETDIRTPSIELWENNPRITPIPDGEEDQRIELHYPSVNRSNQESIPFLGGYTEDLAEKLGRPISLRVNRPQVYLSDKERGWIDQISQHHTHGRRVDFMLVNAGVKDCFPSKAWPVEYYQEVVTKTVGFVQWVQVGSPEHHHPELHGVINLVGQTNHRQFVRLAWHSKGGLGPVTYLQHLCAAFEKPYICLLGGREPTTWTQYPLQHTLHTLGLLDCCRTQACWKSKVEVNDEADRGSLCDRPYYGLTRVIAQCMAMITPEDVIRVVSKIGKG